MPEDTVEQQGKNYIRIEEIRSEVERRLSEILLLIPAEQTEALLVKVSELIVWTAANDRLRWARDFDKLVNDIDSGNAPKMSAREALVCVAIRFRESIGNVENMILGGRDGE